MVTREGVDWLLLVKLEGSIHSVYNLINVKNNKEMEILYMSLPSNEGVRTCGQTGLLDHP